MVSAMQQRGHCVCASHVTCSELTRAVAAVLCAVMLSAVAPLQQPFHAAQGAYRVRAQECACIVCTFMCSLLCTDCCVCVCVVAMRGYAGCDVTAMPSLP
jgi:hypothetical protein